MITPASTSMSKRHKGTSPFIQIDVVAVSKTCEDEAWGKAGSGALDVTEFLG